MFGLGFWGSFILDNLIWSPPAVMSAISSFYLFVLLRIDYICRSDDVKVKCFLRVNPWIMFYLGLFSLVCILLIQPTSPYFDWLLERFDLNDLISSKVNDFSYRKFVFVLFVTNYLLAFHNLVYSGFVIRILDKNELLKWNQKAKINMFFFVMIVLSILTVLLHVFLFSL